MNKIIAILIVTMIILTSCGKKEGKMEEKIVNGITQYINSGIPADPNAKLEFKKLFSFSSEAQIDTSAYFKRPISLTVDKMNNIFILDVVSMSVKKFDNDGKFIKSIGRSGQGPGEFFWPTIMMIDNDTLKVVSAGSNKLSKFDLDGNFYNEKSIKMARIRNPKISRDGKRFVSNIVHIIQKEGQQPDIDFTLSIIDTDSIKEKYSLNSKVVSMKDMMEGNLDLNDMIIPFCPGDEYVYVSENSDSQYRIFGYDYTGEKKFEIRKKYKKIRYEANEKEKYSENVKKASLNKSQEMTFGNYKKAISNIHTDKYGRLLVIPNVDRNSDPEGVYIDIFKDGKFLNRVDYSIQDKETSGVLSMLTTNEYFLKDRLYVVDLEELRVNVYDY